MAPPVLVATASHIGRVRANNEDRVYADPDRGGFAVIDGVGGQAAGELAAQTALETIQQRLQLGIGTPAERVREAIVLANDQIRQQARAYPDRYGMACVLTLVLLQNGTLTAGHVGDTRLYKMRGGALRKLTHDHSPIGEREDRGELTESEAMRHPRRNEVYREVGIEPHGPDEEGFIELIEEPFEPDAALLLCSDGLSDVLASIAIAGVIERHAGNPTLVVETLIERANEASGKDNVSVVYVEGAAFASATHQPAEMSGGPTQGRGLAVAAATTRDESLRLPPGAVTTALGEGADTSAAVSYATRVPSAASDSDAATVSHASTAAEPTRARVGTSTRRVWWFVGGLLIGVATALAVAYAMRHVLIPDVEQTVAGPRALVVGASASAQYRTIGDAASVARPGDTIQVQPGEYREQLVVPDGVAVIATPAREAVLRAPPDALQPWTAVIVPAPVDDGRVEGTRVSGLKIAGQAQAPIAIGVHVFGRAALDDLEVSGTTLAGVAVAGGAVGVMGAFLHDNAGPAFALRGGEARLAHNLLVRNGTATPSGVAIVLEGTPQVTFVGNVVDGDPMHRVRGLAPDQLSRFSETNVVLHPPAPPNPARLPRASTSRTPPRGSSAGTPSDSSSRPPR
jgi:PPM family protein phosphatase